MNNIRNLVFDLGNVLITYDNESILTDAGCSKKEAKEIVDKVIWDKYGIWEMRDRGLINTEEMLLLYERAFPDDYPDIENFITHEEWCTLNNSKTWDYIKKLKNKGFNIYIVSNYAEEVFRKHTVARSFMQYVDGKAVSYEMHAVKPEKEIYEFLCNKYKLIPDECLFFDDLINNIRGAENIGMHGILVTSQEQLRGELEKLQLREAA